MELRDLKVGMYFRTKAGTINKIDSLTDDKSEFYFDTKPIFSDGECLGSKWGYTKDIIKASDKLIDLIEVGDIFEFKELRTHISNNSNTKYYEDYIFDIHNKDELEFIKKELKENHIKILRVLTKEQFDQMSYKVGE